nr:MULTISPECIES: hypothetical protein [Geobacillus]
MTFVLFGATGDLAKRKIFPALYNLFLDQKMPQPFSIIGVSVYCKIKMQRSAENLA